MKIALLGYGRMGKAIEQIAVDRGHSVVAKIDKLAKRGTIHKNKAANLKSKLAKKIAAL